MDPKRKMLLQICTTCGSPATREHHMYYFLKGYLEATAAMPTAEDNITAKEFARGLLIDIEEEYPIENNIS